MNQIALINPEFQVVERRAQRRSPANKNVQLHVNENLLGSCVIKDISKTGARLVVPQFFWVPSNFLIKDLFDGVIIKVEQKWRKGQEIGVRFTGFSENEATA